MTFGEKIRNLRKSKNMNQTQLANSIGVSLRTIRGWKQKGAIQSSMIFIRNLLTRLDAMFHI